MNGSSHCAVAFLALACLDAKERAILWPRWRGIEAGATLSDEFKIMWEPREAGARGRELVHRCFIDSRDARDHGCVTRALDHAEGSIAFVNDFLAGRLAGAYSEVEFLENLGMFLGILCHHVADLCTPVHVGQDINCHLMGFPSRKALHAKVEDDIDRLAPEVTLRLSRPRRVPPSREFFWGIAKEAYGRWFCKLDSIYSGKDERRVQSMASGVVSAAVVHTRNVWHTVLSETDMTARSWSNQPMP